MIKKLTFYIFAVFFSGFAFSQTEVKSQEIIWKSPYKINKDEQTVVIPNCESCQLLNEVPYYSKKIKETFNGEPSLKVEAYETASLSSEEVKFLSAYSQFIPSSPVFHIYKAAGNGAEQSVLQGVPLVLENGQVKKITKFTYSVTVVPLPFKPKSFVASSVLGDPSKKWYKISIARDGVYKIDKAFLSSIGVNVSGLNPQHINIYGNATGRLPVKNSVYRPDDLVKNPIFVSGESDGIFDDNDYILFHAYSASKWSYTDNVYRRDLNPYTNNTYYFICISSSEPPLRISSQTQNLTETATITSYDYSLIHESEQRNLLRAGQRFYGEEFDSELTQTFNFSIPDFIASPANLYISYAAQNMFSGSSVRFYYNNNLLNTYSLLISSEDSYVRDEKKMTFTPNTSSVNIKITVNRSNPSVLTYLDKIEIFAKRQLVLSGSAMYFRTADNVGAGNVNKYVIGNVPSNAEVWDVTSRTAPVRMNGQHSGTDYLFNSLADTIREFVVFTPSGYLSPTFVEEVYPQNLHALPYADILIVTHPKFLTYANRLADLHRNDGESVHVVTTKQVYNEFSGGQPDPVGIRFFAKMFYERGAGNSDLIPENLILFGNGHYDPRSIVEGESYVLSYQAENSETSISAFTSDDFFVVLDDAEAFNPSDKLDMGVGRMVVSTNEEAEILLRKTESYLHNLYNSVSTHGDWRLKYTLIADAEDTFITGDCEYVYNKVKNGYPEMIATKIYADAYPQQITAGGIRFPEMENDINRKIEEGCLLISYVGHGGVKGAGQERFITIEQIKNWSNPDKLHLFVSATCDFTRADDPSIESAGTVNLLNPNGGAVALMTTTRSIFYNVNTDVDTNFYNAVFLRDAAYKPLSFGQIFKMTKNGASSSDNKRSFMLIGDPALRLVLPKWKIVTDSLNGVEIANSNIDTLKALSKITVKGHITDASGVLMNSFNGTIIPSVFDKEKLNKTLGQKAGKTTVLDFYSQNNVLYKGNVSVVNGKFEFSFIVPKDINYQFGKGKISYYADNDVIDAGGAETSITVGGVDPNGIQDNIPPVIEAYMNDERFVNGGLTSENPKFIAKLKDDYGINAVGNGIGHDISLVLDGDEANPIILNNYYIADLDSYQSGKISYQMKDLKEGKHTLKIKAWDVNNNSAEYLMDFVVAKKQELALSHVLNYPNPFTTSTNFFFEHNQFEELLESQIQIFTVSGKLVKTINSYVQTSGFRSDGIHWDGRDDFGDQLAKGVYVYTLTVKNSSGDVAKKTEKLVLLK